MTEPQRLWVDVCTPRPHGYTQHAPPVCARYPILSALSRDRSRGLVRSRPNSRRDDDAVLHATRDDEVALRDARVEDENEDRAHRRERREASRRARRRRRSRGRDEHFRCVDDDVGFARRRRRRRRRRTRSMAGCARARDGWVKIISMQPPRARARGSCGLTGDGDDVCAHGRGIAADVGVRSIRSIARV